jgi:hypothetical protein
MTGGVVNVDFFGFNKYQVHVSESSFGWWL